MGAVFFRDHVAMPWPNGAGITYEVTRVPEAGDFDWRISLADIDNDGPFSVLSGVDRVLVLMEGDHMFLTDENDSYRIDELVGFAFPGEIPFDCKLPAGPARDLNIMTRRGKVTAEVEVLGGGIHNIDASADTHVIVGLRGETMVEGETIVYRDAAVLSGNVEVKSLGTFSHIIFKNV
jgi:environmental stress-induced protein Ves